MGRRFPRVAVRDELALLALARGQALRLRATTDSMEPAIRPGDLLLVRRERIGVGDVAVVRPALAFVTHRVSSLGDCQVELRADRGEGKNAVAPEAILGRVIAVQRPWWRRLWNRWRQARTIPSRP